MENSVPAWFTHVTLGAWNPEGCLVSVIDDPRQAVQAVQALQAAGFTDEHIRLILAGDPPALREGTAWHSRLGQVFFTLINPSDDGAFEEEYRDEAGRGHAILMVYAPRQEQSTRAWGVARNHGAHTVKYYGPWIVRGLH